MDPIEAHNSRWKVSAIVAEDGMRGATPIWRRVNHRIVLVVLVAILIPLVVRASLPAVSYEIPPATLRLDEIREVQERGSVYVTGWALNKTGRDIRKAVFQVRYDRAVPSTCVYLTLRNVRRGARYGFRVPIPRLKVPPGSRVVVPFSIEW